MKGCHDCPCLIQLLNCSTPCCMVLSDFHHPLPEILACLHTGTPLAMWPEQQVWRPPKQKNTPKWWINDGFFCCQRRILNHQKLVDVKMWILLLSCVDINDFRFSLTSVYTVDASDIRLLTRWGWKFISLFTTCLSHIPGQVIPSFQFWSPETDRFFQKSPSELGFNHLAVHSCQHPMGYVESYQNVCKNVDSQTLVTSSTTCTNFIWLEKNSRLLVMSLHVLSCPMFYIQGKSSPSLDI